MRRLGRVALLVGGALTAGLVARSGLGSFAVATSWAAEPLNALLLSSLALFFGGIVALTLTSSGALVRVLSLSPLRWSGRISYGLYLYDPFAILAVSLVAQLVGLDEGSAFGRVVGATAHLMVVYAFALLSWRYIEEPLIRLKTRVAPELWRADVRVAGPVGVSVPNLDTGGVVV